MEKRFVCILIHLLWVFLWSNDVRSQVHNDHGHGQETVVIKPEGPSPFLMTKTFLLEKELNAIQTGKTERVVIDADRVTEIAEILLGRFNCSERLIDESCRECAEVITDRIFVVLETNKLNGIDEEGFNKASLVLLYTLSARNIQHECKNTSGLGNIQHYVTSMNGTGDTTSLMTKEELKSLLNNMTSYYQPSSYAECFDEDSMFSSEIAAKEDLFKIATNVIVKLLEGQCIGHAHEVGPTTFLDAVLQRFSTDDYLSETELDEMMLHLSIGGDHSMHDHRTDDHALENGDEKDHAHVEHQAHNEHGNDHSDHHDHLHRREVVRALTYRNKRNIDNDDDHTHEGHAHSDDEHVTDPTSKYHDDIGKNDLTSLLDKECYNSDELFNIHGINHSVGISRSEFPQICPSLIQQILSGACQLTNHDDDDGRVEATAEVWLYGMLSVTIISSCSLVGGLFLPCMSRDLYATIVNTLVALAVAVMSGDALIHLLPMALGLHDHDGHGHDDHRDHGPFSSEFEYVWKCTVGMITIYAFFLFETMVGFITGHSHSHETDQCSLLAVDTLNKEPQELKPMTYQSAPIQHNGHTSSPANGLSPPNDVVIQNNTHAYESGVSDEQMTADETSPQFVAEERSNGLETNKTMETIEPQRSWICCRNGSLPVMVVIGDGLHNFGDGLAIGAAFLAGMGPGLSTSLAVFCHELPHELGDIAILLKSGISLKWALFLNFLSALTCFAGLIAGIVIGVTLEMRQWIFAVTAGAFLYVALADMLPHVIRVTETKNPKLNFVLVNIGFLCGMGIILTIALYEDSISVKL